MKNIEHPLSVGGEDEVLQDKIWHKLAQALEELGYEFQTDRGLILTSMEVGPLLFPVSVYLTSKNFLGIRVRMAGEVEVPLKKRYYASVRYIQNYLYGSATVDPDEGLYLWRYEGIPVSLDSIANTVSKLFDEIGSSLCEFAPVFQAMEEDKTDREVQEIAKSCAIFVWHREDMNQIQ